MNKNGILLEEFGILGNLWFSYIMAIYFNKVVRQALLPSDILILLAYAQNITDLYVSGLNSSTENSTLYKGCM